MNLALDNKVLDHLNLSTDQLRVDMALGLYVDRRVTLGQAADIAGMSQCELRRLLGQRGVCVQYEIEDYEHDRSVLRERSAM